MLTVCPNWISFFSMGLVWLSLRIKLFRSKMSLVCGRDKIKLDAWTCKSMLSFVKMKTHKKLGSVVASFGLVWFIAWFVLFDPCPHYI